MSKYISRLKKDKKKMPDLIDEELLNLQKIPWEEVDMTY